jgi:peptidyl-prolyl cis-trans isomerase SurA
MRHPARSLRLVCAAAALAFAAPALAQGALEGLLETQQAPEPDSALLLDGIAAQVGSDIVLVSEVRDLAGPAQQRAKAQGASDQDLRMIEAQALERLIEKALIKQVVKRAELQATDEEIDGTISDIAQENGITPEQLKQSVEAQGLPYALYRERIKGEIEHSKVVNGIVGSRVEITDAEVQEIYELQFAKRPQTGVELHARHLLVAPDPAQGGMDGACERANAARERVANGTNLLDAADGLAAADPELGWKHENELAPWLEAALRPLEPGQLSPVIREDFGCVFVQLVERRAVQPLTEEDAKRAIQNQLFQQRMETAYQGFIDDIRSHTYIERKGTVASIEDFQGAGGAAPRS